MYSFYFFKFAIKNCLRNLQNRCSQAFNTDKNEKQGNSWTKIWYAILFKVGLSKVYK